MITTMETARKLSGALSSTSTALKCSPSTQRRFFAIAVCFLLSVSAWVFLRPYLQLTLSTHPLPALTLRVIGYACDEGKCGGWADRQKGMVTAYIIAAMLGVEFKVHMPVPCDVNFFLSPAGRVDWRLEPEELTRAGENRVSKMKYLGADAVEFTEQFLSAVNPLDMFRAEYVFLTTNMDVVALLKKHRLAQKLPWLREKSIPDIYKYVLTELFSLKPGPQATMAAFLHSVPAGNKLVCAQIRMGGATDTETINTEAGLPALLDFLSPYNTSFHSLLLTSDSPGMVRLARSHFPTVSLDNTALGGTVSHVDRYVARDACAGLERTILEQRVLASCHVLVISESGLGRVAAYLRGTDRELFIFHDGVVEKYGRGLPFPTREW